MKTIEFKIDEHQAERLISELLRIGFDRVEPSTDNLRSKRLSSGKTNKKRNKGTA